MKITVSDENHSYVRDCTISYDVSGLWYVGGTYSIISLKRHNDERSISRIEKDKVTILSNYISIHVGDKIYRYRKIYASDVLSVEVSYVHNDIVSILIKEIPIVPPQEQHIQSMIDTIIDNQSYNLLEYGIGEKSLFCCNRGYDCKWVSL